MKYIFDYLIVLAIIFIIDFIAEYYVIGRRSEYTTCKSANYIIIKNKLKLDKKKRSTLVKIVVLVNSIILSIPISLAFILDPKYSLWICGISFILFMIFLLMIYSKIGKLLKKKGW